MEGKEVGEEEQRVQRQVEGWLREEMEERERVMTLLVVRETKERVKVRGRVRIILVREERERDRREGRGRVAKLKTARDFELAISITKCFFLKDH